MNSLGLTIVVPVFNEIATLPEVIESLRDLAIPAYEVIVVDDCSTDGSREWLLAADMTPEPASSVHFQVLLHDRNYGKGRAIRTALDAASGDYVVAQDADLEYHPQDLASMWSVVSASRAPVLYGSRFLGSIEHMQLANWCANRFYSLCLRVLYGAKVTDMHTCYKLVRTSLMREMHLTQDGFGYATEMIAKLLRANVPIAEVPISYRGRSAKLGKKIGWRDGWVCLRDLVRYRFKA